MVLGRGASLINIPVTVKNSLFQMYRIDTYPIPLNHTTDHVTKIVDLPAYFAFDFANPRWEGKTP